MQFNNVEVEVGDVVTFTTPSVPLLEVPATVISVEDGVLEVMSTYLTPFQHDGTFTEDEVILIVVSNTAANAIPQESRGRFSRRQRVVASLADGAHEGNVIAAFDGIVVARQDDGQLLTAGANRFSPVY